VKRESVGVEHVIKVTFAFNQYTVRIASDTGISPQIKEVFEGPGMFLRWRCLSLCLRIGRNAAQTKAKSAYAASLERRKSILWRLSY
jgi:hypothetical protein